MRYQAILFDLDGTLLNTIEDLADSTNFALSAAGYPTRTPDEVRSFVGNGLLNLMKRAVPDGTPDVDIQAALEKMKTYYAAHATVKTKPYPGMVPLLDELKAAGCQIGVISNKVEALSKMLCKHYFSERIDMVIGDSPAYPRKPAPDAARAMMKAFSVGAENTAYVGDSDVDIATARNAGLCPIIVSWGFRRREDLVNAGAKEMADTAAELRAYLFR